MSGECNICGHTGHGEDHHLHQEEDGTYSLNERGIWAVGLDHDTAAAFAKDSHLLASMGAFDDEGGES